MKDDWSPTARCGEEVWDLQASFSIQLLHRARCLQQDSAVNSCLINGTYFSTYSSAAHFNLIDVVIDSDGFQRWSRNFNDFDICSEPEMGG